MNLFSTMAAKWYIATEDTVTICFVSADICECEY